MGVFGTGLYSGDFALDLRSAVAAALRLPFNPDKLVDILRIQSRPQQTPRAMKITRRFGWWSLISLRSERLHAIACAAKLWPS